MYCCIALFGKLFLLQSQGDVGEFQKPAATGGPPGRFSQARSPVGPLRLYFCATHTPAEGSDLLLRFFDISKALPIGLSLMFL
jgi:hypothetical protein